MLYVKTVSLSFRYIICMSSIISIDILYSTVSIFDFYVLMIINSLLFYYVSMTMYFRSLLYSLFPDSDCIQCCCYYSKY